MKFENLFEGKYRFERRYKTIEHILEIVILEIDFSSVFGKDDFIGIKYEIDTTEPDRPGKYIFHRHGYFDRFSTLRTAINEMRRMLRDIESRQKTEVTEKRFKEFKWRDKVKFNDEYMNKNQQKNFLKGF